MTWRVVYKDNQSPVSEPFLLAMTNVSERIRSDVLTKMFEELVEIVWSE